MLPCVSWMSGTVIVEKIMQGAEKSYRVWLTEGLEGIIMLESKVDAGLTDYEMGAFPVCHLHRRRSDRVAF